MESPIGVEIEVDVKDLRVRVIDRDTDLRTGVDPQDVRKHHRVLLHVVGPEDLVLHDAVVGLRELEVRHVVDEAPGGIEGQVLSV